MVEYLDSLIRLLPPPQENVSGPPWGRCRDEVGFDFPSDYRSFVDRYGSGEIGVPGSSSLSIYAPCLVPDQPGDPAGFEGFLAWHITDIAAMWDGCDEDEWGGTVYPMYPEPGGLLTWGENTQGDMFWWLTEGNDPDKWPVIMWARGLATTFRFDFGMVELIHAMVIAENPSPNWTSPDWMHSPETRWLMKSDWRRSGLNVSAGPAV